MLVYFFHWFATWQVVAASGIHLYMKKKADAAAPQNKQISLQSFSFHANTTYNAIRLVN